MSRSDAVAAVRGPIINPAENRLRAPWRIGLWIVLVGFGSAVLTLLFTVVPEPAVETGLTAVVYALAELGWGFLAMGAAGLGFGYLLDRRTLGDFGLGLDAQWWRDAGFGVALGVGLPTLALAGQIAVGWTAVAGVLPTTAGGTFGLGSTSAPVGLALLALFFVVQATAEEVLVRGYLLTNLAEGAAGYVGKSASIAAATVLTGALFGLLHATNPSATPLSVTNITLYGILLGACYVLTGRLGVAVGFHVAWNYALSALDFPVSGIDTGVALVETRSTGPELATGGAFGPEGGLIALPLLALGSGALYWWVRREYGRVEILDAIAVPELRISTRSGGDGS